MKSAALSLKKASRELVEAAGGQTAAATRCRLGQSKLSEAVSPFHADRFLPVDAVGDLEDIAPRS
ncbi:MAG: hypothetical protein IOD07_01400, partial [Bradyrhizobium sp.]|nr:hypothetical protein [Bradyrhizobium sp.]